MPGVICQQPAARSLFKCEEKLHKAQQGVQIARQFLPQQPVLSRPYMRPIFRWNHTWATCRTRPRARRNCTKRYRVSNWHSYPRASPESPA